MYVYDFVFICSLQKKAEMGKKESSLKFIHIFCVDMLRARTVMLKMNVEKSSADENEKLK